MAQFIREGLGRGEGCAKKQMADLRILECASSAQLCGSIDHCQMLVSECSTQQSVNGWLQEGRPILGAKQLCCAARTLLVNQTGGFVLLLLYRWRCAYSPVGVWSR